MSVYEIKNGRICKRTREREKKRCNWVVKEKTRVPEKKIKEVNEKYEDLLLFL